MANHGRPGDSLVMRSTGWVCCHIPAQTPLHSTIHHGPAQRSNPGLLDGRAGAGRWCASARVQTLLSLRGYMSGIRNETLPWWPLILALIDGMLPSSRIAGV